MAALSPWVLIGVGTVVAIVSWINPEARTKLMLFFLIGLIMIIVGVIKLLLRKKKGKEKEK